MKNMKKVVVALIAFVMVTCCCSSANAATNLDPDSIPKSEPKKITISIDPDSVPRNESKPNKFLMIYNENILEKIPNLNLNDEESFEYFVNDEPLNALVKVLNSSKNPQVIVVSSLDDSEDFWEKLKGQKYSDKQILFLVPDEFDEKTQTVFQEKLSEILDEDTCSLGFAYSNGIDKYVVFDNYNK